jgi:CDP-glycerol glycerophosphotransferase (TagB/SpsB family)
LTVSDNTSDYWYFDQIKNLGWDNTKVILRNQYKNNNILGYKHGDWKRN